MFHAVREQIGRLCERQTADDRITARLDQIEETGPPSDRACLRLRRSLPEQPPHDLARAVARDAVDDDELEVVLAARKEMGVPVSAVSCDDEEVGALAALERADLLVPAEDLRRVAGRQREQLEVREA